ncbi:Uncharacterised protein [Mycobacteroides abscessus subsp. abscessus]|nr:Uncharacterised protein [Mycobacteroides abscessus subsp. abscessus]
MLTCRRTKAARLSDGHQQVQYAEIRSARRKRHKDSL